MGLRYKKELLPMKKTQLGLENAIAHIADSKISGGIGDMPMSIAALEAFQRQIEKPGSEYVFPSPKSTASKPSRTFERVDRYSEEGRRALLCTSLYELRRTFATRLSAGGVADHMVTQMLRQEDADAFKPYSQAKLGMMHEAVTKLDRKANERAGNLFTERAS
jgi:integrase